MNLEAHIEDIRAGIKAGRYANEAAVSQGIVMRVLEALGWPKYDTQIVCPEYSLKGRRVDFALCHPASRPIAFIEVKQIGHSEGAEGQLFEYAYVEGIPLAILTDGQEWNFFLPAGQGHFGDRRVYKLDLMERNAAESAATLTRYLGYQAIVSGQALSAAQEDYKNVSKDRLMKASLPIAWGKLIAEEDGLLIELLADKVESVCGYRPDPDMTAVFLRSHTETPIPKHLPAAPSRVTQAALAREPASEKMSPKAQMPLGFTLDGKFHNAKNAREVLTEVFEVLTRKDPLFLERFAALKHGKTRRYLAKRPEDLYPGRADLAREHSHQLSSGWWLGTNVSRAQISTIITMALEVSGRAASKSLQFSLGG